MRTNLHTVSNMKEFYEPPRMVVVEIMGEGIICTSPVGLNITPGAYPSWGEPIVII